MVPDIDRAMRDPRTLEDLIDVVEYYGVYVASLTGNIDLTTDSGIRPRAAWSISATRNRGTHRGVLSTVSGMQRCKAVTRWPAAAVRVAKGSIRLNKREAAHIRRELPRILAGVSPLTLAKEWTARGIPTVTGAPWRAATIQNIYLRPRIYGMVVYRGEILYDADGNYVRGQWDAILTEDEYNSVVAKWGRSGKRCSHDWEQRGADTGPSTCCLRLCGAESAARGWSATRRRNRRENSKNSIGARQRARRMWVRNAACRAGQRIHQGARHSRAAENRVPQAGRPSAMA